MMMKARTAIALMLPVMMLVMAGCGGDSEGGIERGALIGPAGGTVISGDRNSTVEVPAAAIAQPQRFTVAKVNNPPSDPGLVADTAYRYAPEDWEFDAPVTITIGYLATNIPEGVEEASLQIARLQPAGWAPVGTSAVDPSAGAVSAQITRLGTFAIIGRADAPAGQYAFDRRWGTHGSAGGQFGAMGGIAYHGGLVFVSDMIPFATERIQRFDANGVFLGACVDFDEAGGPTGGIDVDDSGDMYTSVTDIFTKVAAGCGLVFRRDAADLELTDFAPTDVALDGAGNLFIAERESHRITVLNAVGALVRQIGAQGAGDGEFNTVGGVAVGPDGSIYATDHLGDRVLKFSSVGAFLGAWGGGGDGQGRFDGPRGIDVDGDGNVYVADSANNRVQVFDSHGAFITAFGAEGDGDGQFDAPIDLAVTPDGSTVYVLDAQNHQVQTFVRR